MRSDFVARGCVFAYALNIEYKRSLKVYRDVTETSQTV